LTVVSTDSLVASSERSERGAGGLSLCTIRRLRREPASPELSVQMARVGAAAKRHYERITGVTVEDWIQD
jgi:hypothetical protein